MPSAELRACLGIDGTDSKVMEEGAGYVIGQLPASRLPFIIERLALTHRAGRYLGSCALEDAGKFARAVNLPPGTIAVRVKRFQGEGSPDQANQIMRKVGECISQSRKVDLTRPDVKLRVLMSHGLHFYMDQVQVDREQFEGRHVRSRPFFSPISLHPRYARALVNLTRVRAGDTLLDPFCGTGGILLEASLVGARVLGSDISPEMIEGCRENLRHFNAGYERLEVLDVEKVADTFGQVDAVATDPPYGRSATTRKEPVLGLHERGMKAIAEALAPQGKAGIVLPYPCQDRRGLELLESHRQRVHRSLDRHYCLLMRRAP